MFARTWEFESPLRHHKKINGLEEKVFLLARFSFSQIAILPHYAPTPGNLLKFLGVPTCRCPHLSWGRLSALAARPSLTKLTLSKLFLVIRLECPRGAFLFSQSQSPFTVHAPSQKIRPPPVFTEEGRNLALLCLWLYATAAGELASCRCGVVVGGSHGLTSQPLGQYTSTKGKVLRKAKA